ncbi:TetR/AcrR family transcriptional regulator [Motiliproteus sp. SC1-56]|uniref:TetR/AcrR family transcriptional regulator n=1 Tax=Motiliproteus sp. SC1-56 TaxID=2799565 RepID=UPI001A8E5AFF|nr:TetR/AcrR family transcriptional regulator [Motiliproteus sp. SC1-56]
MNVKLKQDSWINEAFSALAEGGVDSVKVEVLAKRLKVTKGGFYWHFKNRGDLLARLLENWRDGRIRTIAEQTTTNQSAYETLRFLLDLYTGPSNPRGSAIELAVRDWARTDVDAAAAVREVDDARLSSVAALFEQLGLDADQAYARAFLFYSYIFGQSLLHTGGVSPNETQIKGLCAALLVPEAS